jgi:hypothetical protein
MDALEGRYSAVVSGAGEVHHQLAVLREALDHKVAELEAGNATLETEVNRLTITNNSLLLEYNRAKAALAQVESEATQLVQTRNSDEHRLTSGIGPVRDAHGLMLQLTSKHDGGIHGLMELVVQSAQKLSAISTPLGGSPVGSPLRRSGYSTPGSGGVGGVGSGGDSSNNSVSSNRSISYRRYLARAAGHLIDANGDGSAAIISKVGVVGAGPPPLTLTDLPAVPPSLAAAPGPRLY